MKVTESLPTEALDFSRLSLTFATFSLLNNLLAHECLIKEDLIFSPVCSE